MRAKKYAIGTAGIVLLISAFASSNALAGTYAAASASLMEGNTAETVRLCTRLAMEHDPRGQACLGTLYSEGIGVNRDDGRAAYWFRLAADQGFASAENNLGRLYDKGRGVSRDYALAAQWFRKAAGQGNAMAQENLGFLYELGAGVSKNYAQAAHWYRKAADQGLTLAQINLGGLYETGHGLPQDSNLAAHWYQQAAEQWDPLGMTELAKLYVHGRGVRYDPLLAYALYNLAAEIDLMPNNAAKDRDQLATHMTRVKILQAKQLSREMMEPGKFKSVYRKYLKQH